MTFAKSILLSALLSLSLTYIQGQQGQTVAVGKTVTTVRLADTNDNPKLLPFLGEKVVTLFYTDPDAKDVNDPLSDALKAKNFSADKYVGIGIANCKNTWLPDAGIRVKARQKEKQFPGSLILLDENLVLAGAWGLGNCDDAGVVIVVGKDSKIKFFKVVKSQIESKAVISQVLKIVQDEIAK